MESAVQQVSSEVYANQVKLFGKWNCDEVDVDDISLKVRHIEANFQLHTLKPN